MKRATFTIICLLYHQLMVSAAGYQAGVQAYEQKNYQQSKNILLHLEKIPPADNAWSLFYLSGIYQKQDSTIKSLEYGFKALNAAVRVSDAVLQAKCHMRIFTAQYRGKHYERALLHARAGMMAAPDDELRNLNRYNLAIAHFKLQKLDSALYHFQTCYNYFLAEKDVTSLANTLTYLGLVYYGVADYPRARQYYLDLLDVAQEYQLTSSIGFALNNIGNSYLKQGKNDSARIYLLQALPYKEEPALVSTYYNLAKISEDPLTHLMAAAAAYSGNGYLEDYMKSLQQLMTHHTSRDSMYKYSTLLADLAVKQIELRSQVKHNSDFYEIEIFMTRQALQLAQQKANRQIWLIAILAIVGVVLFVFGFWLVRAARRGQRELRTAVAELDQELDTILER